MLPLLLAAGGAGLGLLKSGQEKKQAERDRALAARTAELSPWTGMTPQMPKNVDTFGNVLAGGLAGAQMGMGVEALGQQQQMLNKMGGAPVPAEPMVPASVESMQETAMKPQFMQQGAGMYKPKMPWMNMNPGMLYS